MTLKRIYTAGPYTARTPELIRANVERALLFADPIRRAGGVPVVPHICLPPFHGMTDEEEIYQAAMRECFSHLLSCDAILMLPGWEKSRGARLELAQAEEWGIEICHSIGDVEALIRRAA